MCPLWIVTGSFTVIGWTGDCNRLKAYSFHIYILLFHDLSFLPSLSHTSSQNFEQKHAKNAKGNRSSILCELLFKSAILKLHTVWGLHLGS